MECIWILDIFLPFFSAAVLTSTESVDVATIGCNRSKRISLQMPLAELPCSIFLLDADIFNIVSTDGRSKMCT